MTDAEKKRLRAVGDSATCAKIGLWLGEVGGTWGIFGGEAGITSTCMCGATKSHIAIVLPDGTWACSSKTLIVVAESLGFNPWPTE